MSGKIARNKDDRIFRRIQERKGSNSELIFPTPLFETGYFLLPLVASVSVKCQELTPEPAIENVLRLWRPDLPLLGAARYQVVTERIMASEAAG